MNRRQFVYGLVVAPFVSQQAGWAQTPITALLNERSKVSGVWRVNILATVRDEKNEIVRGLTKDDFLLQDDGQPREIQYFGQDTSVPLSIGIVFDIRWAMSSHQNEEKAAAREFLARVMRDQDQGFLVSFATGVALDQPLTSRQDLDHAIATLKWATKPLHGTSGDPRLPAGSVSITTFFANKLFDAIGVSSDKVLRPQRGRKAVIVLSNGFDSDSAYSISEAIGAAQRAQAAVYTVMLEPENKRATYIWKTIPEQTGGRHFAYDRNPLADAFGAIEDDLRNQYSLGFEIQDPTVGFHTVRVTTKQKDYKVQARTHYHVGN
jgi:VWFA-related protein